jgi:hypothetical protein
VAQEKTPREVPEPVREAQEPLSGWAEPSAADVLCCHEGAPPLGMAGGGDGGRARVQPKEQTQGGGQHEAAAGSAAMVHLRGSHRTRRPRPWQATPVCRHHEWPPGMRRPSVRCCGVSGSYQASPPGGRLAAGSACAPLSSQWAWTRWSAWRRPPLVALALLATAPRRAAAAAVAAVAAVAAAAVAAAVASASSPPVQGAPPAASALRRPFLPRVWPRASVALLRRWRRCQSHGLREQPPGHPTPRMRSPMRRPAPPP